MGIETLPFSQLIAEVVDNRGRSCPTVNHGVPLIATNCIRNELLYPTYDKVRFVSHETYATWFRGHPLPGDILFVNKATPGRVCLVPSPVGFCIAQDMVAVRADTRKVYPKYLLAALRSKVVQDQISQMHVGTLIPHFKKGDFDKLLIPVPTPYDQQFIGDTYFELSAKIDLNRKMNETLEGIARAIFKSWFVDFDPVRAKAEGHDPGLPTELADLFPSSFVDSELGPIREGWEVKPTGDCVTCVKGKSYSSAELKSSTTALVTLKSFDPGGGYRPEGLKPYTGGFKAEQVVRSGDLVIACTDVTQAAEVVGRPAIVQSSDAFDSLVASLDVLIVRPRSPRVSVPFLYCLFRTDAFKDHTYAHSTGTTVLHLSNEAVPSYDSVVPSPGVSRRFDALATLLFAQADKRERESRILAALRDALLPKLISGELRVPDAERIVGRCV